MSPAGHVGVRPHALALSLAMSLAALGADLAVRGVLAGYASWTATSPTWPTWAEAHTNPR